MSFDYLFYLFITERAVPFRACVDRERNHWATFHTKVHKSLTLKILDVRCVCVCVLKVLLQGRHDVSFSVPFLISPLSRLLLLSQIFIGKIFICIHVKTQENDCEMI